MASEELEAAWKKLEAAAMRIKQERDMLADAVRTINQVLGILAEKMREGGSDGQG